MTEKKNNKLNLNTKQKEFCKFYVETNNATQSALKAGYSKKTAYSIGSENLSKPEIKAYIDKLREKKEAEFYYSRSMSFEKLDLAQNIALSRVKNHFNKQTGEWEEVANPDIQSFIKAEELKGKLQGLYVERSETKTDFNVNCMGTVKIGAKELTLKLGQEPEKEDEE